MANLSIDIWLSVFNNFICLMAMASIMINAQLKIICPFHDSCSSRPPQLHGKCCIVSIMKVIYAVNIVSKIKELYRPVALHFGTINNMTVKISMAGNKVALDLEKGFSNGDIDNCSLNKL